MTPKQYTDTQGIPFPATVLDDRSGVPQKNGAFGLAPAGRRVDQLPPSTFLNVRAKAAEGERLMAVGQYSQAFHLFLEALDLLPDPRERWNAAGWLLVALGENAVRAGSFTTALAPLQDAMACPGTIGNPWVHLRFGQVRFELGEIERAEDELARAYMGGGRAVFEGQDPKYFAVVERTLLPPPGMDRLL